MGHSRNPPSGDDLLRSGPAVIPDVEIQTEETIRPRRLASPATPSKQEIAEHRVSHVPPKSWCPDCNAGNMVAAPHCVKPSRDERTIRRVAMDSAFLDRTDEIQTSRTETPVLNIKGSKTGNVCSIPAPQKGIDPAEYATGKTLEAIKLLGHRKIILRTGGGPAIQKVADHVAIHRGPDARAAPETTPPGDSKRNGFIENANKILEAQARTLLSALPRNIGCRIGGDWGVFPWIIAHSGTCINIFHVQPGCDGKPTYELARGEHPTENF